MTITTSIDIGKLISRTPGVQGGRPYIAGRAVSVMRLAGWHKEGWEPEEIARRVGLDMAQVYAALAYYYANRDEMEADITDEEAAYKEYEEEYRRKAS